LLLRIFIGNCLKKFVKRKGIYKPEILVSDLRERSEKEKKEEKKDKSKEEELRTSNLFKIVVP
jgi:hypothetical protein